MGKVTWGGDLDADAIDKADRSQFRPYAGPTVPFGLYAWRIKVLKRGQSSNKNPQIIVGLELVPRKSRPEEKSYAGFFMTDYITLTDAAAFRVASFTDAIGVTGADLIKRTKDTGEKDSRGSTEIVSIGSWKHDKKQLILASFAADTDPKSKTGRKITGYWAPEALEADPKSKGRDDDDEDEGEDDEFEDDDNPPHSREELEAMKLKDLKALYLATCEEEDEEPEDLDGLKKPAVIDLYLALVGDEDSDDDEDDSDDEDDDDSDSDAEPEPEPAKGKKKAAAKAAPAKKAGKSKAKKDDDEDNEAPF